MRLDKYLKVSRLIKRRPVANEACDAGRIQVNGRVAKASLDIKPSDIIEIGFGDKQVKVEVLALKKPIRRKQRRNYIALFRDFFTFFSKKPEKITKIFKNQEKS